MTFQYVYILLLRAGCIQHEYSMVYVLFQMDIENGLSGRIRFDNGKRTDFKLDLVELSQSGLRNASVSDYFENKTS